MFDFFKKRKKKKKFSKIFNNTFFSEKGYAISDFNEKDDLITRIKNVLLSKTNTLVEFFDSIKQYPKVVEYVFEHIPIIYDDSLLDKAKTIRKCLEENKKLRSIYSKYRESLKKDFKKQIKKLRISYIYKFWENFGKEYMLKKHNAQFDIGKDIREEIESWWKNLVDPKVCNEIYFNILDIGSHLLSVFDGLFRVAFLPSIGNVFFTFKRKLLENKKELPKEVLKKVADGLNEDYKKLREKLITECYAKNFPKSILDLISPDDINKALVKYIKENKLTFEELIEKINNVLKLIANLKFDDINK